MHLFFRLKWLKFKTDKPLKYFEWKGGVPKSFFPFFLEYYMSARQNS